VPENVSIAYRGANYAIGQGPQFYGIWHAAASQSQPLEWWPLTPEGWTGAWYRFASIEVPGTIAPMTQPTAASPATPAAEPATIAGPAPSAAQSADAGHDQDFAPAALAAGQGPDAVDVKRTSRIAASLLAVGVALGVVGLFPTYIDGASLASQPSDVVPHAIYLAAWSLSAVLILIGGARMRAGTMIGLGVSLVTFGLFFADAGTPMASGLHFMGAGLVLSILGWAACAAGVSLAFRTMLSIKNQDAGNGLVSRRGLASRLGRPSSHDIVPVVTLMLAAVGAAIAFAPSWDRFTLLTAAGASQTITEGNAFANPVPVIIGDVLVMAALVAVVVVAALWRPTRLGAALAAGAIIPMVAQAISAIVQLSGPTSPLQFGISQAQAAQLGLTIGAGLTPIFWVFCAFLATLILLCVWMLLAPGSAASDPAVPHSAAPYPATPYPATPYVATPYWPHPGGGAPPAAGVSGPTAFAPGGQSSPAPQQ
jgi:hypothetical protein